MSYQYQPQPGYPPPSYPPPKSNKGLIIGLSAVAVAAVVALVLVLVLRGNDDNQGSGEAKGATPAPGLPSAGGGAKSGGGTSGSGTSGSGNSGGGSSGDSTGSARALGQKVTEIIQNHAVDEAQKLLCKPDSKFMRSLNGLDGTEVTVTLKDVQETGDTAVVNFTIVRTSDSKSADQRANLSQVSGKWCIT
jgi:hypothetical protein